MIILPIYGVLKIAVNVNGLWPEMKPIINSHLSPNIIDFSVFSIYTAIKFMPLYVYTFSIVEKVLYIFMLYILTYIQHNSYLARNTSGVIRAY